MFGQIHLGKEKKRGKVSALLNVDLKKIAVKFIWPHDACYTWPVS